MSNNIDKSALFKIGYGLYAVTTNDGTRDNAFICNTVTQVTDTPLRVAVTVNKANYSHATALKTGVMNVLCLTEAAPFSMFEDFGFKSGKDTDKLSGYEFDRSENGLAVLNQNVNACISLKVEQYVDLGTHGMFICAVTESFNVGQGETMTYSYYHANVKPKAKLSKKVSYVCEICGYVYEGDPLPEDFICPWCKHGADDFKRVEQ